MKKRKQKTFGHCNMNYRWRQGIMLKNSLPNAIELVLKPFVKGDFEYAAINEKVKPELYINEEKSFYGGWVQLQHSV